MPRKANASALSIPILIRFNEETIARADNLVDHMSSVRGGSSSRTEVIREAVMRGLLSLEWERDRK